ncbi:glycosyltransferase family 4 protein [Actinomyces vulturis]|uniref:glycosyltransferase family 4 protein n=1 Tax=Actinomyces vulturis TaxID=1857645 RepID=UPI000834CE2F|nr:glycosyltransferase family 4 protein [Actinomyces vulturis]
MRIGLVCPYSFDAPGGVQVHITDLAQELMRRGHEVEVLAPAGKETSLPSWVTSAGEAVPIPYNGSVARLNFGAVVARRARKWLEHGQFDLLHIHEPITPSVGMLALQAATGPVVATFHASVDRSLARELISPAAVPLMEKITARIAVSQAARRTLLQYHEADAVVIPNGVYVKPFQDAPSSPQWVGTPESPTIAFLGRMDESRKGLPILAGAIPHVLRQIPGARFFIAGRGDATEAKRDLAPYADHVQFLGGITDEEKMSLLSSVDAYIAPQTGGESFGIVLVEGMAAGTNVIASNIPAFEDVLDHGALGHTFINEDSEDLARVIIDTLTNIDDSTARRAAADKAVGRYDWSTVTDSIIDVYDMALSTDHSRVTVDPSSATLLGRLREAWSEMWDEVDR